MTNKFTINNRTKRMFAIVAVLVFLFVLAGVLEPKFFKIRTMENMLKTVLPVIVVGCGMTYVIISGNIDLSVGSVMSFSAVMFAYFAIWGLNIWLAALCTALVGASIGLINGFITEKLGLPAFMTTIATMTTFGGLALTICNAVAVKGPEIKPITKLYRTRIFFDIPITLVIIVGVVALFMFLEKKTVLGKYALSIGGNKTAAKLAGINVAKTNISFFVMSSTLAALSGVFLTSKTGMGSPLVGYGKEFDILAACILGGINIKGGEGSIMKMVIGALILVVLATGMDMNGVQSYYQDVVKGVILLAAIVIDVVAKKNIK